MLIFNESLLDFLMFIFELYIEEFSPTLNPSMLQAASTVVLVLVTILYAIQTRRNADLFRRQLELENDREHAKTLKSRISDWLNGYPEVGDVTVSEFNERTEPYAAPDKLNNDPYFIDLINNHTNSIQPYNNRIDKYYTEFTELQEEFINAQNVENEFKNIEYIEPVPKNYAKWLFDQIILLQRDNSRKKDDLKQSIRNTIENDSKQIKDTFHIQSSIPERCGETILHYYPKRRTLQERSNLRIVAPSIAVGPQQHIENIESLPKYHRAVEAAKLLDNIESELEGLRIRLIEYSEYPRFKGSCDLMYGVDEL